MSSGPESRPSRIPAPNSSSDWPLRSVSPSSRNSSSSCSQSLVVDDAGAEGVDGDPARGQVPRAGMGHRDDRELARAVGGEEREALLAGDRGSVDDLAAASLRLQLLGRLLHAEQDAETVDPHDPVLVFFGDFQEVLGLRDPGVVEHDVEPTELGHRGVERRLTLSRSPTSQATPIALPPACTISSPPRPGAVAVDIGDGDVCALGAQPLRDALPDALRGPVITQALSSSLPIPTPFSSSRRGS